MRTFKILFFFFLPSSFILAQAPPGYYNAANGLSGTPLQNALHNIIKNHTVIPYSNLYVAFDSTDLKANGQVWDMYSDNPTGTPPYVYYNNSTYQCGNYNSEGDCFNREHSWPQSWFNGVSPPYSDLFHLFPTDGWVNNKRANYPYGEVSNPSWTSLNGSKLGPNTTVGYNLTVFEPIDAYKGDIARGYFYMATRYLGEDTGWSTSDATNKAVIEPWQLCVLLSWHHQDVVSAKELDRNDAIYKLQNNRNPFIDHPEWVDSVFTCTLVSIEQHKKTELAIFPNPGNGHFTISTSAATAGEIKVIDVLGREVYCSKLDGAQAMELDLSSSKGVHTLVLQTTTYAIRKKIVIQ